MPLALGYEDLPEPHGLGLAALEQDDPTAAALGEVGVGVEELAGLPVELVEVAHAEGARVGRDADVEQVLDEHAERRAPVPDVVLAQDAVAEKAEDPGQRVADDGGAQVADVHLLGHVGRRVVDDDGLRLGRRLHPQALVRCHDGDLRRDEVAGQPQVDEAGPADLDLGDAGQVGRGGDLVGDGAGRAAQPLAQGQGAVGLEVGPVRRAQDGVRPGLDGVEGGLQALKEQAGRVGHPTFSHSGRAPLSGAAGQPAGAPMAPSANP